MGVQLWHKNKKNDNNYNNKLSWKIDRLTKLIEKLLNKLS
jgi:hypothetical protein